MYDCRDSAIIRRIAKGVQGASTTAERTPLIKQYKKYGAVDAEAIDAIDNRNHALLQNPLHHPQASTRVDQVEIGRLVVPEWLLKRKPQSPATRLAIQEDTEVQVAAAPSLQLTGNQLIIMNTFFAAAMEPTPYSKLEHLVPAESPVADFRHSARNLIAALNERSDVPIVEKFGNNRSAAYMLSAHVQVVDGRVREQPGRLSA
jgi:hypothetical protein